MKTSNTLTTTTLPWLFAVLFTLFFSLLSGCGNSPSRMIFTPDGSPSLQRIYNSPTVTLTVADQRPGQQLLTVNKAGNGKQHYPAATPVTEKLQHSLRNGLTKQGIRVVNPHDQAAAHITLTVHRLEALIEQSPLKYDAAFVVELRINVNTKDHTFKKTFTGNATHQGILQFDMARIELELNRLTGKVLNNIFNDHELQQSIKD